MHRRVHLGIAVDVDVEALVVPVVHDAGRHAAAGAGRRRSPTLADRARGQAARRADELDRRHVHHHQRRRLRHGGHRADHQPAAGRHPVDRRRADAAGGACAAPDGEWAVAVHPVGNLSLSFDHRAVDGAYAAAFLAQVRDILETRDWAEEVWMTRRADDTVRAGLPGRAS